MIPESIERSAIVDKNDWICVEFAISFERCSIPVDCEHLPCDLQDQKRL
jgi:hypothetical protein